MIFVDTNVFVYAVGRPHPNQNYSRLFFWQALQRRVRLYTSIEVMQELLHVFIGGGRIDEFDAALGILTTYGVEVLPLEMGDLELARELHDRYPRLSARDLCHLAVSKRRRIADLMTFDQSLRVAFYGEK